MKIYAKGVIRIRKSKKNRQHNGQKKKYKQRSTKHTHKTNVRITRTPLKTGCEFGCSGRVSSSWSTSGTRLVSSPCQRQYELLPLLGLCRPLTFHILIFSSENPQPNELNLGRKHLWKVLSKECTFCYNPLPNMAATGNSCF